MEVEKVDGYRLGYEETELRLGLPGDGDAARGSGGKRGFSETIDLKLKLHMAVSEETTVEKEEKMKRSLSGNDLVHCIIDPEKPPPPKVQVVGWPPVRSFMKNALSVRNGSATKDETERHGNGTSFVKVSMDGAPYLRKVDLKMYKSYQELSNALDKMFNSFTTEYVPTYEDKDGDLMLVGDVPWEMFVDSCKRLRIMKGSEAIGLAPQSMNKFKNLS